MSRESSAHRTFARVAGLLVSFAGITGAAGDEHLRRGEEIAGPVTARVLRIIDGDTLVVSARIWIGQSLETRVRIAGVDAPELRGDCAVEMEMAAAARDLVALTLGGERVVLRHVRNDKYGGRVLAAVESSTGIDIAAMLIAAGLGRPYDGGKRDSWCRGRDITAAKSGL